jgi:hypothetical protein
MASCFDCKEENGQLFRGRMASCFGCSGGERLAASLLLRRRMASYFDCSGGEWPATPTAQEENGQLLRERMAS